VTHAKVDFLAARLNSNIAGAYLELAQVYAKGVAELKSGSGGGEKKEESTETLPGCAAGKRVQKEVLELALERIDMAIELDKAWAKPAERREKILNAISELGM
jgi:hypothetical protein